MKDKIETPVFIVFLVGAFVFSCITFVLGIWVCDSSHKTSNRLSTVKVVDNYSEDITADDLNILDDKETDNFDNTKSKPTFQNDSVVQENKNVNSNLENEDKKVNKVEKKENSLNKTKPTTASNSKKKTIKKNSKKQLVKPKKQSVNKKKVKGKQYYVQIIATSKKSVALNEKKKYERKGYNVFLVKSQKGNTTIYKVRIGTFKTKAQANKIAKKISKEYKITPWVL